MDVNREVLDKCLKEIDSSLEEEDVDTARKQLDELREALGLHSDLDQATIGVHVDVWSYDHNDDVYFVFSEYDSPDEAVEEKVANHVHSLVSPSGGSLADCTAQMRDDSSSVSKRSYKAIDTDIEVSIHTDVYYFRIEVYSEGNQSGMIRRPSTEEIVEAINSVIPESN